MRQRLYIVNCFTRELATFSDQFRLGVLPDATYTAIAAFTFCSTGKFSRVTPDTPESPKVLAKNCRCGMF